MPELPEVETVCRGLRARILGRSIVRVMVRTSDVLHMAQPDVAAFTKVLTGTYIEAIMRRGKYILFALAKEGKKLWLLCHLRMTGKLLVRKADDAPEKHTHLVFFLDDGQAVHYHDVRRFGGFTLMQEDPFARPPLAALGPEPLSEAFDAATFKARCKGRKRPVKAQLLDQSVVAGIGNIYADEILFRAGVRPRKSAARLTAAECGAIVEATKDVLQEAIAAGGSTIRDYVDSEAKAGSFQLAHQVYGRAGQLCRQCGTTLKSVQVAGRSSVYCPHCQKS